MSAGQPPALVAAAMKGAAVVWLSPAGGRAVAAWVLWREGAGYVVGGPGELPLPGIEPGAPCLVTVASTDGQVLTWTAAVDQLRPGSEEWIEIVPQLLTRRLNAAADAETRWARSGRVLRLVPIEESTLAAHPVATSYP